MGKQFGAIYLILGTCVAAGLLGLPVVTAQHDFLITSLMIISAWILMTAGAWCLLQVTLTMPQGANLISMSQKTLGNTVKNITWLVYLLLLYSLICAYLAASGDLLEHLFHDAHIIIPRFLATILAAFILGGIVTNGIRSVDLVNRGLMTTKIIICLLLIGSVMPFAHLKNLSLGNTQWSNNAWLVVICAFGYAIISLPKVVLEALHLSIGSVMNLSLEDDKIVLTPANDATTLEDLLKACPSERFALSDEDLEWAHAKSRGKEI